MTPPEALARRQIDDQLAQAGWVVPFRGERQFKSIASAQRFLGAVSRFCDHFRPRRHLLSAADYPLVRHERYVAWHELSVVAASA